METKVLRLLERLENKKEYKDINFEVLRNIIKGEKEVEREINSREDEIEVQEEIDEWVMDIYDFLNGTGKYVGTYESEEEILVSGYLESRKKIEIIVGE
jgi:hypothetical protein